MSAQQHDDDQAATDRAAAEAVALVTAGYLAETHGRALNRQQRDLRTRAERLARWLQRQATNGGRL
jgi:hypothetical protein